MLRSIGAHEIAETTNLIENIQTSLTDSVDSVPWYQHSFLEAVVAVDVRHNYDDKRYHD